MCKHEKAYLTGTMDTIWACYVTWACDCGAKGDINITRDEYNKLHDEYNKLHDNDT